MTTLTLINASGDDEWAHVYFVALSFKVRVMSSESYRKFIVKSKCSNNGKTWLFRACDATFIAINILFAQPLNSNRLMQSHTYFYPFAIIFLWLSLQHPKQIVSTWNYAYRTFGHSECVFRSLKKNVWKK